MNERKEYVWVQLMIGRDREESKDPGQFMVESTGMVMVGAI